jgi:hypothetical protein
MSASINVPALQRLQQLQAEVAKLQQSAVQELMDRRTVITRELASIDSEIAELTGKSREGKVPRTSSSSARKLSLQQLKEELMAAPNKTLNIRKAKLELSNIKELVQANPALLKLGGNGAWPTVTLLGPTKSKLYPDEPELG